MPETTGTRARRGAGSSRRRSNGLWEVRQAGQSHYGATLKEAQQKAKDATKRDRLAAARRSPTLAEWLDEWLLRERERIRQGTWAKYDQRCRVHIKPSLGHKRLTSLRPDDIDKLNADVLAKKSVGATTAHHIHMTLSAALHDALRRGMVTTVVTSAVRAPRRNHPEMLTLTDDELTRLVEAAKGEPEESLYVVASKLGLRLGELLALRWKDITLTGAGSIRIVGTVTRSHDGGLVIGPPKTNNGRRLLTPLPTSVRDALVATPRRGELVWPGPDGGPWSGTRFWSSWDAVRKRAGLTRPSETPGGEPRAPRFHDLRHTVATRLLDRGVAPQTVALVLGDTVQTVMNTYAHATARGLDAAMAAVDDS